MFTECPFLFIVIALTEIVIKRKIFSGGIIMKSLKKVGVAALVAALAVTAAAFVACTDPAEEGPQTVEAEQISSCKVEYNWADS